VSQKFKNSNSSDFEARTEIPLDPPFVKGDISMQCFDDGGLREFPSLKKRG
jgi:hypothetical protein